MIRCVVIIGMTSFAITAAAFAANPPATQPVTMTIPGTVVQFTMVKLPAGSVDIAIPRQDPQTVQLKSFWIGLTEVTWDEFDVYDRKLDMTSEDQKLAAVGVTHPTPPYGDPGYGHRTNGYPAMSITPNTAQQYCKWLSAKLGKKFRLPTEAEWEYACRAGAAPTRPTASELEPIAWFADNSAGEDGEPSVQPVARKQPNAFGLYDMLGNVAELTIPDEQPVVARGGAYRDIADRVHCRARAPFNPKVWQARDPQIPQSNWWLSDAPFVGFRIVMEE